MARSHPFLFRPIIAVIVTVNPQIESVWAAIALDTHFLLRNGSGGDSGGRKTYQENESAIGRKEGSAFPKE